jgi:hypothetical protein
MKRNILYALLASFVIIQFIRPEKNIAAGPFDQDIQSRFPMNTTVKTAFERSCYDCHSNNTRYPWYYNIQPVAWWLQHHVDEGKSELNFNEFGTYKTDKMDHKLEEIAEVVHEEEMPLKSYRLAHKEATLSEAEKNAIITWANESRAILKLGQNGKGNHEESKKDAH